MSSKYPAQYKIQLPVIDVPTPASVDHPEGKTTRNIGAEIVEIVLSQPSGQGGFGIKDVVKRVPLVKRLKLDPKELIVNENEKQLILESFDTFRFSVAGAEILDTYNAVVNAENCALAAV